MIEICGDGKNLSILECDDNNLENGDGCSSECKIEDNFICSGGSGSSPDSCQYTIPPKVLIANLTSNNSVYLEFDRPVRMIGI